MNDKRCRHCGLSQELDAFGSNRSQPDRLDLYCRDCRREYTKAWNANNPEKVRAAQVRYYCRHKEERSENTRRFHENRPGYRKVASRKWREEHPDYDAARGRQKRLIRNLPRIIELEEHYAKPGFRRFLGRIPIPRKRAAKVEPELRLM